jgi:hypothetical protein
MLPCQYICMCVINSNYYCIRFVRCCAVLLCRVCCEERNAQAGSSGAVKSVIFPIFTKMMWLSAFSSVLLALLMIFVPVHLTHGPNDWIGKSNPLLPPPSPSLVV